MTRQDALDYAIQVLNSHSSTDKDKECAEILDRMAQQMNDAKLRAKKKRTWTEGAKHARTFSS